MSDNQTLKKKLTSYLEKKIGPKADSFNSPNPGLFKKGSIIDAFTTDHLMTGYSDEEDEFFKSAKKQKTVSAKVTRPLDTK